MYLVVGILTIVEFFVLTWVLRGGQPVLAGVGLAFVVSAIWGWEITILLDVSRGIERMHPAVKSRSIIYVYVLWWAVQGCAALVCFLNMRVHTLPAAFELFASHVTVSAVLLMTLNCILQFISKPIFVTINGRPWWEVGISCAACSPVCGLLSILACKALQLF